MAQEAGRLRRRAGQTDVPKKALLDADVHGRFTDSIAAALRADPGLLAEVASRLLEAHFPPSLHQDILDAVGLDLAFTETVTRRKRDPAFRGKVLTAYEFACAVCGFDVRLGNQPIGLEAAHIQVKYAAKYPKAWERLEKDRDVLLAEPRCSPRDFRGP